ncbi:Stk1 family PASTA domain-containing Ser/Thr kinase [Aerococcus sp. UMB1112A]|uniref:Stk1 family PASTA domain-containing Ser/Thr kinase n=1 Tax=Aerococcus sp. UMB1112A TaxID=3050609 RepID=UPI00254EA41C|nr:Stk1 family PASTA domain-containing Ser/Thr kinase [Aerococcus sp. UMB1112A]MDK8502960.1 Stk1 family PASTA domain-containing Ser/Thr kinase [Aerococcus sp. UMB1112A]
MRIGQLIDERYELLSHIGSGGMANVYLAFDHILERQVAIKFLRLDLDDETDSIRRFRREAMSITELDHPNIVDVYDIGDKERENYIVMEYVDGKDLKTYIRDNHPISPQTYQVIMLQILDGVQCAHDHGIVHRDLKPQNIMVKADGTVKIMDFGIAIISTETSITQTSTIIGSVHYLSPEQARGSLATAQSDIYSLGIVSFEMLTGHVPFDGESAVSIALKHFQEDLPALDAERSHIPNSIQNVIYKATAKDPSDRYQSCRDMAEDLATALDAENLEVPLVNGPGLAAETIILAKPDLDAQAEADKLDQTLVLPTAGATSGTASTSQVEASDLKRSEGPRPDPAEDRTVKTRSQGIWAKLQSLPRWLVASALIVLLLLSVTVYSAMTRVRVPDVAKMTPDQAVQLIQEAGLRVGDQQEESSEDIQDGRVTRTDPEASSRVKEDAEIDLYVSTGPKKVTLKDYRDKPFDEAKRELEEEGFKVKKEEVYDNQIKSGHVVDQDPGSGQEVQVKGTTVTLKVSKGKETFSLQDLAGKTQSEVQAYADSIGLNLTTSSEYSNQVEAGRVIRQNPSPSTKVQAGDSLSVVLSLGPEKPATVQFSHTITIPYSDPAEGEEEEEEESRSSSSSSSSRHSRQDRRNDSTVGLRNLAEPTALFKSWRTWPVWTRVQASEWTKDQPLLARGENHIEIYIDDYNHSYASPADSFTISRDTSYTLDFETVEGDIASFKVVRDGRTIIENRVKASD